MEVDFEERVYQVVIPAGPAWVGLLSGNGDDAIPGMILVARHRVVRCYYDPEQWQPTDNCAATRVPVEDGIVWMEADDFYDDLTNALQFFGGQFIHGPDWPAKPSLVELEWIDLRCQTRRRGNACGVGTTNVPTPQAVYFLCISFYSRRTIT